MKKVLSVLLVLVMVFALAGCSSGPKLEEDQVHYTLTKDGELTLKMYGELDELEDDFDIDEDDSEKDIAEDIVDYFDDEMDLDVEVTVKKSKDMVTVTIVIEDAEDFYFFGDLEQSLEDLCDDYTGDDDIEDFLDSWDIEFQEFKNEKDVDNDDMEDYKDDFIMSVYGGDEGVYYTLPSDILLVSDFDFERVNNNTIFVEDGEDGYVIYKEY